MGPSLPNCRRRPVLHPPVPASAGYARCGLRMAQRFIMRPFATMIALPSVGAPSYRWTPRAVRGLLRSRIRGAIPFRRHLLSPAAGLPSWRPPCPRHNPEASVAFTHVHVSATTAPVCHPCVWRCQVTTGPLVWRAMTAAAPPAPPDVWERVGGSPPSNILRPAVRSSVRPDGLLHRGLFIIDRVCSSGPGPSIRSQPAALPHREMPDGPTPGP